MEERSFSAIAVANQLNTETKTHTETTDDGDGGPGVEIGTNPQTFIHRIPICLGSERQVIPESSTSAKHINPTPTTIQHQPSSPISKKARLSVAGVPRLTETIG